MKLKQLLNDDGAVSPVIGVILMVAITVILAAVIATFVLGFGEQISDSAPNASFSFDYNQSAGELDVTHSGGPNIDADQLDWAGDTSDWSLDTDWSGTVSAGDTAELLSLDSDEVVRIVWENDNGDTSSILAEFTAP